MCKFCNEEAGNVNHVASASKAIQVGGVTVSDVYISVNIFNEDNKHYTMAFDSYIGNKTLIRKDLHIRYCPFCGRKFNPDA